MSMPSDPKGIGPLMLVISACGAGVSFAATIAGFIDNSWVLTTVFGILTMLCVIGIILYGIQAKYITSD